MITHRLNLVPAHRLNFRTKWIYFEENACLELENKIFKECVKNNDRINLLIYSSKFF